MRYEVLFALIINQLGTVLTCMIISRIIAKEQ